MTSKDIRIFWDSRSRCWIIANDYKYRRMLDRGYSVLKAKQESHGHLRRKEDALIIKSNILANKKIKSKELWIINCYIRICDKTYKHYKWIKELSATRISQTSAKKEGEI